MVGLIGCVIKTVTRGRQGAAITSISWSPLVNLMPQYFLQQLAAAKMGSRWGLAVSDTFATGAVARSFQTCSLQFRCDRSCCKEVENLQSRISFATDAVANTFGLGEIAPVSFESEYASFDLATASVANEIRDCKFSTSLQQLLSHLNWKLQV